MGGGRQEARLVVVVVLVVAVACWAAGRAACQPPPLLTFPHAVSALAVSRGRLLVASGNCWYEAEPSLAAPAEARHCQPQGGEGEGAVNKLLLPFGGSRLLTCWSRPLGSCYEQDLGGGNGSAPAPRRDFGEELVSYAAGGAAAGTMYAFGSAWYLIVATTHKVNDSSYSPRRSQSQSKQSLALTAVSIMGEGAAGVGESQQLLLAAENVLAFADAFRWRQHFFFPYYHHNRSGEPKMLLVPQDVMQNHITGHRQMVLRCDHRSTILSSAFLEERAFWIGVFRSPKGEAGPTSTALCIFDLKQFLRNSTEECKTRTTVEFVPQSRDSACVSSLVWF